MVLEKPMALETESGLADEICGINCNWGFGLGVVILIVGPLPGPT